MMIFLVAISRTITCWLLKLNYLFIFCLKQGHVPIMTHWRSAFILVSIIDLIPTEDASIQLRLGPFNVEVLNVHSVKNLTNLSRLMTVQRDTSICGLELNDLPLLYFYEESIASPPSP